ncbi:putative protein kinase [Leishmania braziliensis MHOM/BR/75/M2904]|uniref:Protein kinase domain-containing protein n=2 Tax=Leishmania braziliensis TaxID=5660 RepID=A4HPC9_LEIBR|nr:putative protein kinase [Leishmania braziliensis MHOM/BR/75/M2904]CAJ2481500.1 unnamed protein product [Leishmania braziliensis]CAM44036.1 putative protein kinase [Leishmania braziliensis MHOM/BR/75/M2904]SYZ70095.1 protein_kinase [Leishmania braziliensis MHOM/BR/75/M2904]
MELRQLKPWPSKCATTTMKGSSPLRLRANSPTTTSTSPATTSAATAASMSVLYSVLLRTSVLRSSVVKNPAEHSLHSHSRADMDWSVREAVRTEVERLLPYRGVTFESAGVADSDKRTPAQSFLGSAAKGEKGERSGCCSSHVASAKAFCHASEPNGHNPRASVPSTTTSVAVTDAPSSLVTRERSSLVSQGLSIGPRVVIKRLPRRKARAAAAAAPAPTASKLDSTEAPEHLSASPFAGNCNRGDCVTREEEASSCTAPSDITGNTRSSTVVLAAQLPDIQRHLDRLFDDFSAAVEQCRVTLDQQQLQSGSLALWKTARKKRNASPDEPSASWPRAEVSSSRHPQPPPHTTPTCHRRDNPTIPVTDVLPCHNSHRPVSDLPSPDYILDEQGHSHGTATATNENGCAFYTLSPSTESSRIVDGSAEQITPSLEIEDLPRGIVIIAHAIAEHLNAILHPTPEVAALGEEAAAALPDQGRGGRGGSSELTALLAVPTTACRGSHAGRTGESRGPASPVSFAFPSTSPASCPSRVFQSLPGSSLTSPALRELQQLVHNRLWLRITTFLSSVSLNTPGDDCSMPQPTAPVEQREACAYAQLPFWIWLYAACGLATDVIHAQQEAQSALVTPGKVEKLRQRLIPPSSTTSVQPSLSLSQLLPMVETLARQLQRREYERVQPMEETLLTANTFLSFAGVQMTDRAVMKRLFPLQSSAADSDALGFAALLPHSARCTTHGTSATTESSSGNAIAGIFDAAATPSPINIMSPNRLISADHTMSTFVITEPIVDRSSSGGSVARGSSLHRGQGANGDIGNMAASATGEEAQQMYSGRYSCPSTVELYLQWLESADSAGFSAFVPPSEAEQSPDRAGAEAHTAGGTAASLRDSPPPCRSDTIAYTQVNASLMAEEGQFDDRNGSIAREDSSRGKGRSSSDGSSICATQQRASELFQVAAVMPSADLAPCLRRAEKELYQARSAVQFARKLGTLYATQDMNTLLPLLPAVARGEPMSPNSNLFSARSDGGPMEDLGGTLPPRGSTDGTGTPASPEALDGGVYLQSTWTDTPTTSNPMTGGLPSLVVPPSQAVTDRVSGRHDPFSFHRVIAEATSPTLFPSVTSPSMEQRFLMEHLNSCAAAIAPSSDQLFLDTTRALEVAFSLAVVLLSHVMGEAAPKGQAACGERTAPVASTGDSSASAVSAKTKTATVTAVVVKQHPSKVAAAAPSDKSEGNAATTTMAAPPPPRPLSMDLANVFGFGSSGFRWQHLSAYVRETLISVALRTLQRKDAVMTQELLQYIALDTAIAHHYAQVRRHHPVPTLGLAKGAGRALKKSCDISKAAGPQVTDFSMSPPESPANFVNVWFSSFANLADTTTHLLQSDHRTPSSLKGAVWHLAGLAQYFLVTRARGYAMYGGQSHLCPTTLSGCGSGNAVGIDVRTSLVPSSAALQSFIASQLVDPAGRVFGVIVSFMDSVCQALSVEIESGGAAGRQYSEGVMFTGDSSDDESSLMCPTVDGSVYLGSAGESANLCSSDGGVYGMDSNRPEIFDFQACWMELAIHYFFEIVDVLLDAALHLPQKPLYLYQLIVSASYMAGPSGDFTDSLAIAGLAGGGGSPPLWGHSDLSVSVVLTAPQVVADSPLGRVQEFLSMYTSMVLQSAVTHFTVDGRLAQSQTDTTHGTPLNTAKAAGGVSEDNSSHIFWERLLSSLAASAHSAALGEVPPAMWQPPLSAWTPSSAAAANAAVCSEAPGDSSYMPNTMWWPNARFQRYSHLIRIVEHAQLVSLYMSSSAGNDPAPTAPNVSHLESPRAPRDGALMLQVNPITALLNTSTGPCAQLLSISYACPPLAVDTSGSSLVPGSARTTLRERHWFSCSGSPVDQLPGRFPPIANRRVLTDRVMREVCGGLWIRVEVLRLLRIAAAPMDVTTFASFTTAATDVAVQVQDKTMQTHYKAIASMKAGTESVLPKTYASTYVRLLFLRYVQAFYTDMQALSASGPTTAPDHTPSEHVECLSNMISHVSSRGDSTPCRTLGSPLMRSPATPFQHLTQRLWMHYCHHLLWVLRELCWSCAEAHETAANLSVASVFGRLLQMISGRGELEEDEEIDGCDNESVEGLLDAQYRNSKSVGMSLITFNRSVAPYSAVEGSGMEGFVDFELSSPDSSVTVVPELSEGCKRPPRPQQDSPSSVDSERRREPSWNALQSPVSDASTKAEGVAVNISDLASVRDLSERRRLGLNPHSITGGGEAAMGSVTPLAISSTSVPAPPRSPVTGPPVVLQLPLTGLKPPLYFTSSGDTAAAQENDFYKEQSKQRQISGETAERFLNTTSVSVVDVATYTSHDHEDEDDGECNVEYEACFGTQVSTFKHTLPRSASPESCVSCTTASANTHSASSGDVPKPPALTVPKLSLRALSPPLYFTSTGDTGVFAERTMSTSLLGPQAPMFPSSQPTPGAPAASETAKVSTLLPQSPLPVPVLLTSTPTTVGGVVLPKLSFSSLNPPMYFTSTGDTGGFVEAQNQKPQTATGADAITQFHADPTCLHAGLAAQGTACGGKVDTASASVAASTVSNGPSAATAAAHLDERLSSDELNPGFIFSDFAGFAPTGGNASGGRNDSDECRGCADCVGKQNAKERCAARRHGGCGLSLNSSTVPEVDSLSLRTDQRRRRRVPRTSRSVLAPIVAPAVTMELILSICSIILQQDSGMIQYVYTVSSLTQKRVLPGMSSSSQRRRHTGSSSAGAASGVTFTQKPDAAQTDRWWYTPQHSPSSFHVIQAMHNYLKDSRNSLVIDLLEEWVLLEYAAAERARMEWYESVYASSREQECSQQLPHFSLSHSASSGSTSNAMHPSYPNQRHAGTTGGSRSGKPSTAMLAGRYVLLRLLLPRAITPLVTVQNERRIGSGGYGFVTSGFVQEFGPGCNMQLPPGWGQCGSRWKPAETRGSAAASGSGAGGGVATPSSLCTGRSFATTAERVAPGVLDGLRVPWRTAVQRIAQAVCRCEVAIKHVPLNVQGSESGNLPLCHAEVLAMYRLRGHPHIIPLLSFDNTKDEYILVLPYYTQGSLRLWRQKHYPLGCAVFTLPPGMKNSRRSGSTSTTSPTRASSTPTPGAAPSTSLFATCARCLLQVLKAVAFMHDHHIRHGDIKCDNILIASADASAERGEMDPPTLPSSVQLCDFGSCDTCDDDDMQNLKHDIMAGEARFLAGRWGVGRGTEAIQPPELMSAKRRYGLLRRIMKAVAPAATATPATSSYFALSERTDRGANTGGFTGASAENLPLRGRGGEVMEPAGRQVTELLRRAELSVDIWACGCLLYEMLTGRMLFGEARLGRLLVLAAVDDGEEQGPKAATSKANAAAATLPALHFPLQKVATAAKASVGGDADLSFTPSVSRKALDDWEWRDLEAAVGKRVVDFMSSLLDLEPLQRPSAYEALNYWKAIMVEAGLEV